MAVMGLWAWVIHAQNLMKLWAGALSPTEHYSPPHCPSQAREDVAASARMEVMKSSFDLPDWKNVIGLAILIPDEDGLTLVAPEPADEFH